MGVVRLCLVSTALAAVALTAAAAEPAAAPVQSPPFKPGDVAFSAEVAPVLLGQCVQCHGDRDPRSNLRMTSLASLLEGGRAGPAVVPGKSEDSLLVKKLRGVGVEGRRMPLGKDPLPEEQIATIARWIDQGARLDQLTPRDSLEALAAAARAARLSDEQLSQERFSAGERLWARVIPDEPAQVRAGGGLCLVGNLPTERMDALAAEAEAIGREVRRELGVADGPLAKGGVVVYLFRKPYDDSEFWQVALGSERPKGLDGHAGVTGDIVYAALVVPPGDESGADTRLLLAEQIAGAALAARRLPDWFCRGAGRTVAVRIAPRAPRAQGWKREAASAAKSLGSAADFLEGRGDRAAAALAAGGFMASLARGGKVAQFVPLVDGGMPFEEAFTKVFRSQPQQAFTAWLTRNAGR